ncbi:MAG TPA: D-aminoacyl-tRNA deacylase [Opitutales bacterium]|nr:D-aminoacyl-tRNA deacylase [Opitutales bacterium]
MRAVVQRVKEASVSVDGEIVGKIGKGLLVFIGVQEGDSLEDVQWMGRKIPGLRIFEDGHGRMNESVIDVDGGILAISQFTLFADVRKGTRPSFNHAAKPELAEKLYEALISDLEGALCKPVRHGVFGADMTIPAVNDGPVTIILDSRLG